MPKYNCIIDVVSPHLCSEEPHEFDKTVDPVNPFHEMNGKFVRKLNELQPSPLRNISEEPTTGDLRPREHLRNEIPSAAPQSILDAVKNRE